MTNKPMLSVERELLERVVDNRYREKENISIARHEALWELRALLDKPVEPSKFVGAAQYWSENEQALRDVCRFGGLKGLVYQVVRDRDRTAAQHHGEPVELQHMAVAEDGKLRWMTGRKMQNCELYAIPDGSAIRSKLYAEHPAPVSVELPELESALEAWWESDGQYCRAGGGSYEKTFAYRAYEAALAEVARLNGVKP